MNEFDRTKNGYLILERWPTGWGGEIIIAFLGSHESEINSLHPFVVWEKAEDGHTFQGSYCANMAEAVLVFQRRGGQLTDMLGNAVTYDIREAAPA